MQAVRHCLTTRAGRHAAMAALGLFSVTGAVLVSALLLAARFWR